MNSQSDYPESHDAHYRLYELGEDGRIHTATPIGAGTDEEAVQRAQQMVNGRVLELWDRSRMILRLDSMSDRGAV